MFCGVVDPFLLVLRVDDYELLEMGARWDNNSL